MSNWGYYLFCLLLCPLLVGYAFHRDYSYEKLVNEKEAVYKPGSGRITTGYFPSTAVFWILLGSFTLLFLLLGWRMALSYTGEMVLRLMVVLVVYYPLLLLALPLLRRVVSARCCAVLGTLPTFLFVYNSTSLFDLLPPKVVVRLPKGLFPTLLWVWLAGTVAVLVWKTAGHLLFRRRLLAGTRPVTDGNTLELWDYEQQRIERKKDKPIPLVISPQIASPLTIGLRTPTLVTVLPDRPYTQEELELIFRHELRHVQRLDSSTKLFFTLCLALCWFYPPMWLIYRTSTADLELSCDEMVLDRADEKRRAAYARLLLSQAGDDRGFSTCLSGSAKALEHRLKGALHPKKRLEGTVLVTLTMVCLLLLGSAVAVTDTYGTVREVVLDKLPGVTASPSTVERWDMEAVTATFEKLEVSRASALTNLPEDFSLDADFFFSGEDGGIWFFFSEEGYLYISPENHRQAIRGLYRVEEEVDWDALRRAEM